MVVAADLKTTPTGVTVGPKTHRVDMTAAKVWKHRQRATVCATAGYSPTFNVEMGKECMRADLIGLGVSSDRIIAGGATAFNTGGEMDALVALIKERHADTGVRASRVRLVCRWWHIYRAHRLLQVRLHDHGLTDVCIIRVPVWSLDLVGMLREIRAYKYYKKRGWR